MRRILNFPLTFNSPVMFSLDMIHIMHAVPHYCGINTIHCGSIFVVFVGSSPLQIYTLDRNKFRESFCFAKTENRHIHEITSPRNRKYPKSTIISQHEFK